MLRYPGLLFLAAVLLLLYLLVVLLKAHVVLRLAEVLRFVVGNTGCGDHFAHLEFSELVQVDVCLDDGNGGS